MSESNEPTATSPNAPADRMAKARQAKVEKAKAQEAEADRFAALEAQVLALASQLKAAQSVASVETVHETYRPGEYFVGGVDENGKKVIRKRRWTKADIERMYPTVEFAPAITSPISPHGITYQVEAGKIFRGPSIVKDIHDQTVAGIQRQSMYRVSDADSRQVFEAARNDPLKGKYFEPIKHVGYGWPLEALTAVAKGLGDDAKAMDDIGWESEVGFPGGYNGKPLPVAK